MLTRVSGIVSNLGRLGLTAVASPSTDYQLNRFTTPALKALPAASIYVYSSRASAAALREFRAAGAPRHWQAEQHL